jgi:TonB family protein
LPLFARHHFHSNEPRDLYAVFLEDPAANPSENSPTISAEKSGAIPAADARALRVTLETGSVQVFTDESVRISYHAIAIADSRDPGAEEFLKQFSVAIRKTSAGIVLDGKAPWQGLRGPFNVTIEIHIPRQLNLEVHTGAGNIAVQDSDGRVRLTSGGGSINAGRVGTLGNQPPRDAASQTGKAVMAVAARLETQGGEISVGDVAGSLRASTAGGHITTGNIEGDATLRTGGGQIYARRITGNAEFDSGGGNIHLENAGAGVSADTAGGAIVLRQNDVPLIVSANNGNISAWLADNRPKQNRPAADAGKSGATSRLSSTNGDIILYLPRRLTATIDATIEQGSGHQIAADPSLPLKISYRESADGRRTIHYTGQLNGGGDVVHLKTSSGNIVLRQADPDTQWGSASAARWTGDRRRNVAERLNSDAGEDLTEVDGFFAEVRRRVLESWWGAVPVEAEEMQKHLERSVAPVYPEVARHAGVEGDVILRIYVSSSGQVGDVKILDGPPLLARAAVEAVRQWQYQAPRMNGSPVEVVTTLVVSFRLH